jgi:biotin carboxyl carrier protein
MKITLEGREFDVQVEDGAVIIDGKRYGVSVKKAGEFRTCIVNGRTVYVGLGATTADGTREVNVDGKVIGVRASGGGVAAPAAASKTPAAGSRSRTVHRGAVAAQMTGRVLRINVEAGEEVEEGEPLLILEAMKMENEIRSPRAGTVAAVLVSVGDRVNAGDPLIELTE